MSGELSVAQTKLTRPASRHCGIWLTRNWRLFISCLYCIIIHIFKLVFWLYHNPQHLIVCLMFIILHRSISQLSLQCATLYSPVFTLAHALLSVILITANSFRSLGRRLALAYISSGCNRVHQSLARDYVWYLHGGVFLWKKGISSFAILNRGICFIPHAVTFDAMNIAERYIAYLFTYHIVIHIPFHEKSFWTQVLTKFLNIRLYTDSRYLDLWHSKYSLLLLLSNLIHHCQINMQS